MSSGRSVFSCALGLGLSAFTWAQNPLDGVNQPANPPANPLDGVTISPQPPAQNPPAQNPPTQNPPAQNPAQRPVDPMSDWQANVAPGAIGLLAGNELRQLGAPDWVKPGVRITYYNAAAVVRTSGYRLIEDPTGNYEDPRTGKKYRKTDEDPKAGDEGWGSGDGFTQTDILSVGKNAVAYNATLYSINRAGRNELVPVPGGAGIAFAAAPSDTWIHPAAIARIMQVNTGDFFILKGRITFDNQPVDVLAIVNQGGGNWASYTYDMKTGILLQSSTATKGQSAPVHLPNQPPPGGDMQLTFSKLISIRQTKLPIGGPLPDFVNKTRVMQYGGSCTWRNPVDPSIGTEIPVSMSVQIGDRGPNWVMYKRTVLLTIGGAGQPEEATLAGGDFSQLWIHPRYLANMQPGQVLDEDPVSKVKVACAAADNRTVSISTANDGGQGQFTYDRNTGQCVGATIAVPSSGMTYRIQLQGVR